MAYPIVPRIGVSPLPLEAGALQELPLSAQAASGSVPEVASLEALAAAGTQAVSEAGGSAAVAGLAVGLVAEQAAEQGCLKAATAEEPE